MLWHIFACRICHQPVDEDMDDRKEGSVYVVIRIHISVYVCVYVYIHIYIDRLLTSSTENFYRYEASVWDLRGFCESSGYHFRVSD